MKKVLQILVLVLLAMVAGSSLRAGPANGQPLLSGAWAGGMKAKGWAQYTTKTDSARSKVPIDLQVAQMGGSISIDLTIHGDDGPEFVPMDGYHGSGTFWATGPHPKGGAVMVVGHSKKGDKMKGIGQAYFDSTVWEFKFKAVRAP